MVFLELSLLTCKGVLLAAEQIKLKLGKVCAFSSLNFQTQSTATTICLVESSESLSRAGKVGGCLWYFVPAVSTLTSHSRWSKKPRYTSSALWKSLEKNFLLLAIPDPLCPALLNCPVQFLKTSTEENIKY